MDAIITKSRLRGETTVCGSKSHTIRAIFIAAMAKGTSVLYNPLSSADTLSALRAAESLGARVQVEKDRWIIMGGNLHVPETYIDVGNSGTAMFFLMSIASLLDGCTFLTGEKQVRRRSVAELADALNALGAKTFITRPESECPPVMIQGKRHGGIARFSGFNSQYISGLLLSSPCMDGDTEIFIQTPREKPYLQMTLDWMRNFGAHVENVDGKYEHLIVRGNQAYEPSIHTVPADWSAVIPFLVASVITESHVTITGIDFLDIHGDKAVVSHLMNMGADIRVDVDSGKIEIFGGTKLHGGGVINMTDIPEALPALSVAAAYAEGETLFTGLGHVRRKESDRVAAMEKYLSMMGATVEASEESMHVIGGQPLKGIVADSLGDHRLAMALSVAGLGAQGPMFVRDVECVAVSFPDFFERMQSIGARI